ncbi:MAG: hypothetical protein ACHRHE_04260 [Tepidisphaerales bacterium]
MKSKSELNILRRILDAARVAFPPEAARFVLDLDFDEADHGRMEALSQKASAGTLTAEEEDELRGYVQVGHILALFQAKARMTLHREGFAA